MKDRAAENAPPAPGVLVFHGKSVSGQMPASGSSADRPQVGDVWEGTGTHKPRIRIEAHDERVAKIVLIRSGKRKRLALATIRKSYRLIERNPQRIEHYP